MTCFRKILLAFLLMLPMLTWGQKGGITISGTVTDQSTGETLIGATVMDVLSGKGTVTNAYGRYSLTLPKDSVHLRISYVGYSTWDSLFLLDEHVQLNRRLVPSVELKEVVISGEKVSSARSSQISAIAVPVEHIKAVPVLFGETDILKAIQLLPGVQSGTEGMSGVYVRGGGPDENLFLLDGVPLYNVNHLGGFFSAFNSDAVKNVTLYKGSFPAHFGGRLSSVLDITTNNGNNQKIHGDISVGAIAAKVSLEGPIVNKNTTFSLSARRTYADALIQPILMLATAGSGLATNAGYYFYDLNAKVTHRFSDKSHLFFSYYMGDDVVYARIRTRHFASFLDNEDMWMKMGYNWGNIVSSLRWNYQLNPKLFMNVTGAYTRYRNDISLGLEDHWWGDDYDELEQIDMSYNSGIQDWTGRVDFDYAPNTDHAVKFGGSMVHHLFMPETMGMRLNESSTEIGISGGTQSATIDTTLGEHRVVAEELMGYIEDDWSITDAVKVNLGVNLSGFAVEKKFYPSLQPRVSGRILITDDLSFKAGYSYMTQYMHLLSNSNISLPTDLWVPVTARIEPMKSHQVAAGFFYNLRDIVDLSVEGYYKHMSNLLEYKDGSSFFASSSNWEDKVAMGDGWSYGVEFLAQRTFGKLTGWVGYTWSKTMRQFDRPGMEINNGLAFPAKYDRRHDLSVVLMYKPNSRFDISMTWVYCTGNTATLALQEFPYYEYNPYSFYENISQYSYMEGRNNFRMPAYHRMDLGANFHKHLKRGDRTINISVYNLYNRQNPFVVYERYGYHYNADGVTYGSSLVQLSIFPIIPSISYNFKF